MIRPSGETDGGTTSLRALFDSEECFGTRACGCLSLEWLTGSTLFRSVHETSRRYVSITDKPEETLKLIEYRLGRPFIPYQSAQTSSMPLRVSVHPQRLRVFKERHQLWHF